MLDFAKNCTRVKIVGSSHGEVLLLGDSGGGGSVGGFTCSWNSCGVEEGQGDGGIIG